VPREFSRKHRVADAMQRELSVLIRDQLRDPRIGMVNITDVEVSRDLSSAKVYVTFLDEGEDAEPNEAIDVLNGAAGFLRSQMAKIMQMRTSPRLRFIFDGSSRRGQQLSALIDLAVSQDRSHDEDDSSENGSSEDGN